MGKTLVKLLLNTGHVILMGNQMESTWLKIFSEPFRWIQTPPGQSPTHSERLWICRSKVGTWKESLEWELLDTQIVSLTPWGGALSWMDAVLQVLVPCPWRRGGGSECLVGITCWPCFCEGFGLRILQRYLESLALFTPSQVWGHVFSQNDLHCDHLSAGRGPADSF